jgi:hypothetical protein
MSYVVAAPEMIAAAATDLAAVGSTLSAAHLAAAGPTVAVIPAAADEVSASIAHLFSAHAQDYQALAGQAAAFEQQFVQHLNASAHSFAAAEAANTALLQPLSAIAGPSASAISDLAGQLVNMLTNFWGQVLVFFQELYAVANFALLVAYLAFVLAGLILLFGLLLLEFVFSKVFGFVIPFSLP